MPWHDLEDLGPSRLVERRAGDAPWALGQLGARVWCGSDVRRMRSGLGISGCVPVLRFLLSSGEKKTQVPEAVEGIGCCSTALGFYITPTKT